MAIAARDAAAGAAPPARRRAAAERRRLRDDRARAGPLLWATVRSFAEATWPRYHYVGSIGIVVAACAVLRALRDRLALPRRVAPALGRLAGADVSAWSAIRTHGLQVDARAEVAKMTFHIGHRGPPVADPDRVFIDNRAFAAGGYFSRTTRFPGLAAAFIAFFPGRSDGRQGGLLRRGSRRLVFAARRRRGTRTARLLVTPEELRAHRERRPAPTADLQ